MQENQTDYKQKLSMGMFLVALGIVYGDIGTSPMYVMKSIIEGNGGIAHVDPDFIVGSLSLVICRVSVIRASTFLSSTTRMSRSCNCGRANTCITPSSKSTIVNFAFITKCKFKK